MISSTESIGALLRALREARGLVPAAAARRAGIGRTTLFQWEADLRTPRGAALDRLLDALEAPERLRSRVVALADPRHARFALAERPLGSPVGVGQVLRALRVRRRLTQAEAACALGVAQSTIARWERGDDVPDAGALHRASFALGATGEELAALSVVRGGGEAYGTPEEAVATTVAIQGTEDALHEVLQLGVEAESWWRATRDPAWDVALASATARRALRYLLEGRSEEAEATALRAVRRARTPEARGAAVMAVDVLEHLARTRGVSPAAALRFTRRWAEAVPEGEDKAWAVHVAARTQASAGDPRGALESTRDLPEWYASRTSSAEAARQTAWARYGILLAADDVEGALAQVEAYAHTPLWRRAAAHRLFDEGRPFPEAWRAEFERDLPGLSAEWRLALRRILGESKDSA